MVSTTRKYIVCFQKQGRRARLIGILKSFSSMNIRLRKEHDTNSGAYCKGYVVCYPCKHIKNTDVMTSIQHHRDLILVITQGSMTSVARCITIDIGWGSCFRIFFIGGPVCSVSIFVLLLYWTNPHVMGNLSQAMMNPKHWIQSYLCYNSWCIYYNIARRTCL